MYAMQKGEPKKIISTAINVNGDGTAPNVFKDCRIVDPRDIRIAALEARLAELEAKLAELEKP